MSIDYDAVFNCFIEIARDAIGSKLSEIGPAGGKFPAVIRARQPGVTPAYPYAQLDLISTQQTEGYLQGWMVDAETGDYIAETPYKFLLQFSVYGGNANAIAHDLEAYFRLPSVLDKIEIDTTGTLEDTFPVTSLPEKLSTTQWLEVAQFNITFNIVDRHTTSAEGTFNTITVDAEIKRNEDDPEPLVFSVTESSITP